MQIDVDLLKQFRESADWIMQLPEKMVKAIMNTKVALLNRRERVAKYKELAELREIGKSIQKLYAFKGNILLYANIMQRERNFEDIKEIRRLFASAVELLDDIWAAISETPISSMQLGTEAAQQIETAKTIFKKLRDLPDDALLDDRQLLDILANVNYMAEAGKRLLMTVDAHRRELDCGP
jgi:uncharacterized protein YaaR (DUF327 family)